MQKSIADVIVIVYQICRRMSNSHVIKANRRSSNILLNLHMYV